MGNGKPLRIGSRSSSETGRFKGGIDEVEIFNRVLGADEIFGIYNAGSAGKCKQTVGLNEGDKPFEPDDGPTILTVPNGNIFANGTQAFLPIINN